MSKLMQSAIIIFIVLPIVLILGMIQGCMEAASIIYDIWRKA